VQLGFYIDEIEIEISTRKLSCRTFTQHGLPGRLRGAISIPTKKIERDDDSKKSHPALADASPHLGGAVPGGGAASDAVSAVSDAA